MSLTVVPSSNLGHMSAASWYSPMLPRKLGGSSDERAMGLILAMDRHAVDEYLFLAIGMVERCLTTVSCSYCASISPIKAPMPASRRRISTKQSLKK